MRWRKPCRPSRALSPSSPEHAAQFPADDYSHAVAQHFRVGQNVRREEHRFPLALQLQNNVADFPPPAKKSNREVEYPPNGLRRPWRNTVRKIKEERGSLGCLNLTVADLHEAAILRQHTRETFEQCCFACAIWTDQSQDLACAKLEAHIFERLEVSEPLREAADFKTSEIVHSAPPVSAEPKG